MSVALHNYRLDGLVRISGVSARNIRAYRERGLLDPPRRQGRSAYYDGYHLAQLQTIDELLGRGFTSAHVAEFFETMRAGGNVAEMLGLERAILRPRPESVQSPLPAGPRVEIDPDSADGSRLLELGLAHRSGAALVFANPVIGRAVARAADPLVYARIVLALLDASRGGVESLADDVVSVLEREVVGWPGSLVPNTDNIDDVRRWVTDCAGLGNAVIADHLQRALLRRLVAAVSDVDTARMVREHREPPATGGP